MRVDMTEAERAQKALVALLGDVDVLAQRAYDAAETLHAAVWDASTVTMPVEGQAQRRRARRAWRVADLVGKMTDDVELVHELAGRVLDE